jgi:hypothetical protein
MTWETALSFVAGQAVALAIWALCSNRRFNSWIRWRWRRLWFDQKKYDRVLESLRQTSICNDEKLHMEIGSHPDNGKAGYWLVDGIRHNAIVRTSSAPKAVELAKDLVGDWELVGVRFLGEQFPDTYGY